MTKSLLSLLSLLVTIVKATNLVLRGLAEVAKHTPQMKVNPDQAAVDAAVDEANQVLADEAIELQQAIDELEPNTPISTAGIDKLKDGIEALSNAFKPQLPDIGKFNVRIRVSSPGEQEKLTVSVRDLNCDPEQRDKLLASYQSAVAAGEAEPARGAEFPSSVSFDDGGAVLNHHFTSESQKAAFDAAFLQAGADLAKAQLAALPPVPPVA